MNDMKGSSLERYESAVNSPEYESKLEQLVRESPNWTEIPPVLPSDMKQMWEASRRMNEDIPPRPGHQIGAGVLAAYGVDAAAEPARMIATSMRHAILTGIVQRGTLKDYLHGQDPGDRVFTAMAKIPCTQEDMLVAMLPQLSTQLPADAASEFREAMKAGYDPDMSIDARFIKFLCDTRESDQAGERS